MTDELEINPDADSTLSDLELLDTPEVKEKKVPVEKETSETDEEHPETEDEEEPTDEDEEEELEDTKETRTRPSISTIIEKHPEAKELFKKFPQLRDAYFREGKYAEYFPTLEDAKEASDKVQALDIFNDAVMEGSSKEILEAIKDGNSDSYKKFVENFLPTLNTMDKELYYEVAVPIVDKVILNLFKQGEKLGDKQGQNMMSAAKIMNFYMHDEYEIKENRKTADPEIEKERKKLQDERNQLQSEAGETFENSVNSRVDRSFTKLVMDGLDPENQLSDFTKSKITEDVIHRIGVELSRDRQHMQKMGKLWDAAKKGRFSPEIADRIYTAFLSRAKQLIPEIRSKVKKEATGISHKSNNGTGKTTRRDSSAGGAPRSSTSKTSVDPKSVNWRKTSDMDLLK